MLGHITISDINDALPRALPLLYEHGIRHTADSIANARPTIEWPGLFITEWWRPTRNVLFDPIRDANPFFHYLEAMWILAGRKDVRWLSHVLPRMADYSDNGTTFHAPYGYRLRKHFMIDQLDEAVNILRKSPNSRQVVAAIWDPASDLGAKTKDVPCNDLLMFKVREGRLNLTVSCRSNDAVWGCYGANATQFSTLLMYMAAKLGVEVGTYCQVSDSFHVYVDNPYWKWFADAFVSVPSKWDEPLFLARTKWANMNDDNFFTQGIEHFDEELETFFSETGLTIETGEPVAQFAQSTPVRTAVSMWNVLYWHRKHDPERARTEAWDIGPDGWRAAAFEWLERRRTPK